MSLHSAERYLPNRYEDYEESTARDKFQARDYIPAIDSAIQKLLRVLEHEVPIKADSHDYSVYTGSTGIAMLYMKLAQVYPSRADEYSEKAREILVTQRLNKRRHDFTFLCGDVGPIATRAVLYHRMGLGKEVKADVDLLQKFSTGCVSLETGEPDELLYGRVGFLYALLYVERNITPSSVDHKLIKHVIHSVLESGTLLAAKLKLATPLMYQWHDSYYLGAAHGLCGIIYMLLEAKVFLTETELNTLVKPTLDYLISIKYPSGNYPSSLGSQSDRLVHWCHGAPGYVHLFALAYLVFGEKVYLEEAKSCSDIIWKRGLLKKGYGICHGVAGNAYAFLRLYKVTQEEKYLYRASRFADFCCAYGSHGCRVADRPYSLFEGMAGTIYFLLDMLQPKEAKFPAFEL